MRGNSNNRVCSLSQVSLHHITNCFYRRDQREKERDQRSNGRKKKKSVDSVVMSGREGEICMPEEKERREK